MILFEYGESFSFYFVGDDFAFIDFVMAQRTAMLWKSPSYYHYYPLGVLFNALPACFGVLDPQWYVLIGFLSYWTCSILVMKIFWRITDNRMGGFLAALMFATALPNSEVMYWKTGNQTIAMALFSSLALLMFMRYLDKGSKWDYVGCVMSFAASMLCIEQGSVTFGILLLYDLFFFSIPLMVQPETKIWSVSFELFRRQGILACIPVLLSVLKKSLGYSLLATPLSADSFLTRLRLATDGLAWLVDFNQVYFSGDASSLAILGITTLLLSLFVGYVVVTRNVAGAFLLLVSTGSIFVISFSAGGPGPRYFCLPLVFFACFLSMIFGDLAEFLARGLRRLPALITNSPQGSKGVSGLLSRGIHFAFCLAIIQMGLRGNLARREYWKAASQMEQYMVDTVENLFSSGTIRREKGQKLFLLNIPASIRLEKHSRIYVAQNGFIPDLRHRLGESANEIVILVGGTGLRIPFGDDWRPYGPLKRRNKVSQSEVRRIVEDGNVVLQFSPLTRTFVPIGVDNHGALRFGDMGRE